MMQCRGSRRQRKDHKENKSDDYGLARAVFFNRLGEVRDRSFENQCYRTSGLNLVVSAILLWNTVYLERAVQAIRDLGKDVDGTPLAHLSPWAGSIST